MIFRKKKTKIIYDQYWIQKLAVKRINNRLDYFFPMCKDKSVLHFGCTDYPIFNAESNLHIQLNVIAKELHGFDIDLDGIEVLKNYVAQPYFSKYEDVKDKHYDVCLIPETIEHVDNVKEFLGNLKFINADVFIITAPNCFVQEHYDRNSYENGVYTEIIHPDHNCWYSPFTLKNVIEKYSPLEVRQSLLLQEDRMVCCEAVKK